MVAACCHNCEHWGNKSKAGTEIGRDAAFGDEQVQQRADTVHKQTGCGLTLNKNGTSTVEPNMANKCCMLSGMFSARGGRSSTWIIFLSMHITSFLFYSL